MGCSGITFSSCQQNTVAPNPNKHNFKVMGYIHGDVYDILIVHYPDCTTFDGLKILVVSHGSVDENTKELDPHFFEDGNVIARFIPTGEGINLAQQLLDVTNERKQK